MDKLVHNIRDILRNNGVYPNPNPDTQAGVLIDAANVLGILFEKDDKLTAENRELHEKVRNMAGYKRESVKLERENEDMSAEVSRLVLLIGELRSDIRVAEKELKSSRQNCEILIRSNMALIENLQ